MLERFEAALCTIPFSKTRPGITSLVIRAVDFAETPVVEHDLRAAPAAPEGCLQLARDWEHFDCAYEAGAYWDVWTVENGAWVLAPQRIEVICYGEEYDSGAFQEAGHFQIDVGFDALFTLDETGAAGAVDKLRANVLALHDWAQRFQAALPVARYQVWSDGEENFEARMDEVLARS